MSWEHGYLIISEFSFKGLIKSWWYVNPLPVQFKAVLRGQKGCVFFSGHLNLPTTPEIGLPSREKNHNN